MNFDLEKQYSPSLFSKRFKNVEKPNEEVIKHFISASEKATKLAHQLYKHRLNVRYGGEDDNQLLDIFFKEQEEGTPILVYVHGGLWQELDKTTSGPLVHTVIKHNYRVVLLDYNLCPTVSLEVIMKQISNFFIWLKKYSIETKAAKVSLCGHSAGAHLIMVMFQDTFFESLISFDFIDQVFLISGLYDLSKLWSLESVNPNNILHLNAEKAVQLSPLFWSFNKTIVDFYRTKGVKFHIIVAENDSEAFKNDSREFFKLLEKLTFQVVFKEFEKYDHFSIIEECAVKNSVICQYICKSLHLC